MAWACTYETPIRLAGGTIVCGTITATSGTVGGDVNTGLNVVRSFVMQPSGSTTTAALPVYNETLPLSNTDGAVTVVCTTGTIASFIAIG